MTTLEIWNGYSRSMSADARAFTFGHDWAGGATLTETSTGLCVYFQPGDAVAEIDWRFDDLVRDCGYSGAAALALLWADYGHVAA